MAPVSEQRQFHADGELASVRGAAAAKTTTIVSSHSSVPFGQLVAETKAPLWFQVFAADPTAGARIKEAVSAGCRAVCISVGVVPATGGRFVRTPEARDWQAVATLRRGLTVPVLVKGVSTPEAAKLALQHDIQGLVASTHGSVGGRDQPVVLTLSAIVEAVAGKVPVLVDGSFRRGTDVLKALAFGATAVLVGRPVMWGLAAYGADGVQGVLEMLQTELARYMAMSGKPNLKSIDASLVRVHRA